MEVEEQSGFYREAKFLGNPRNRLPEIRETLIVCGEIKVREMKIVGNPWNLVFNIFESN